MKKVIKIISTAMIGVALASSTVWADPAKGQKYYLKTLKAKFQVNGTRFAAQHTQEEWEELFEDNADGFIKAYSEAYPKAAKFLKNPKNLKKLQHIGDFAIEYGSDSGNVPSCG